MSCWRLSSDHGRCPRVAVIRSVACDHGYTAGVTGIVRSEENSARIIYIILRWTCNDGMCGTDVGYCHSIRMYSISNYFSTIIHVLLVSSPLENWGHVSSVCDSTRHPDSIPVP